VSVEGLDGPDRLARTTGERCPQRQRPEQRRNFGYVQAERTDEPALELLEVDG
jgi:hypothetical protein